jgi:diaminopimelate decarboxylase
MTVAPLQDNRFRVTEALARELAETYGTPLYVIDEGHFRERIRAYRDAFKAAAPKSEITFASKANSTVALLAIAYQEGCAIDVASEGEFRAALAAGVPAARCHVHGNNKTRGEIEFALRQGAGQIVVDNFNEIETIAEMSNFIGETELVLRLAPGVDPITHRHISTGQADTKFGFNIGDGSAEEATVRCLELHLPLVGFHCHIGSQLLDPEAHRVAGVVMAEFAARMKADQGMETTYLNLGGGLGVRYTSADQPMSLEEFNRLIVQAILTGFGDSGLNPTLAQEPGRALVAESGTTLYRVGVVKQVPAKDRDTRTYVCVDGGLSDNPRPAMYGSRYTVERVAPAQSTQCELVTVSGKHCESDKLFEDVELPSDVRPGDLLQVLCTGAYNSSMASNYNRYPRPATALIRPDGSHCLIQRRESWDELLARDILPEGLGG